MISPVLHLKQAARLDRFYIDGEWTLPSTISAMARTAVICPSTEETLCEIPLGDAKDVDHAVLAARRAFPQWSATSPRARAALLDRIHGLMTERTELFAQAYCPARRHGNCTRTYRRVRTHHAVELADIPNHGESRPGTGCRLHGCSETQRTIGAKRVAVCRSDGRCRHSRGRVQSGQRDRTGSGCGTRLTSSGGHGIDHRINACGRAGRADGCANRQARGSGAWRQVPKYRAAGR